MGDETDNKYLRLRLQHVTKHVWHLLVVQRLWWERVVCDTLYCSVLCATVDSSEFSIRKATAYMFLCKFSFSKSKDALNRLWTKHNQKNLQKGTWFGYNILPNKPTSFKFITDLELEPIKVLKTSSYAPIKSFNRYIVVWQQWLIKINDGLLK